MKEKKSNADIALPKEIRDIFQELLINQRDDTLKSFLDAGADEILRGIETMEDYRRALETIKLKKEEKEFTGKEGPTKKSLLKFLKEGTVEEFNNVLSKHVVLYPDLSYANLSEANLVGVNLGFANLSGANLSLDDLSFAELIFANLSAADLSFTNLSAADLSHDNLSGANLSSARLTGSIIVNINGYDDVILNRETDFFDAI